MSAAALLTTVWPWRPWLDPRLWSCMLQMCCTQLTQAERRLAEEVERVKNYLDASTEPKITRVAEHELITVQVRVRVVVGQQQYSAAM